MYTVLESYSVLCTIRYMRTRLYEDHHAPIIIPKASPQAASHATSTFQGSPDPIRVSASVLDAREGLGLQVIVQRDSTMYT